ncbi:unnamed protein product (mitochondrion) [Plasmodiophora brassicae]|uniref:Glycosyltransferase 2-like domain-containing protein n=2 Tax=Plasmodiophora brassicae TaxID=37360 RepID=A0A3P3YPD3_PLABS|nr:unnamed protein product [Plasmodiophora brassicae]
MTGGTWVGRALRRAAQRPGVCLAGAVLAALSVGVIVSVALLPEVGPRAHRVARPARNRAPAYWPPNQDVRRDFRNFAQALSSIARPERAAMVRICIVTYSLVGPTKNGGIGTADTAMAELLASDGRFAVTVLYVGEAPDSIAPWVQHYATKGVHLVPLPDSEVTISANRYATVSYLVYRWLRAQEHAFDIVRFHEWHGPGYFSLLAKRQGESSCSSTTFVVTLHCPSTFYLEGSRRPFSSMNAFVSDFLERQSVALTDILVSPSAFMLEWVQQRPEWPTLPGRTFVQPNVLMPSVARSSSVASTGAQRVPVHELVFFGRLEVLKGFHIFCDALDILFSSSMPLPLGVTFLGRPNFGTSSDSTVDAVARIRDRARQWSIEPIILTEMSQPEAVAYLRHGSGRLAVMPSFVENSPYAVLECLAMGVPFIASAVGGTPELVDPRDTKSVLFAPVTAEALANAVGEAVELGAVVARSVVNHTANGAETAELHWRIAQPDRLVPPELPHPIVAVCIVHRNRGTLLQQSIDGVLQQRYDPMRMDIVIVADGSDDRMSLDALDSLELRLRDLVTSQQLHGAQVIRDSIRSTGAARNTAFQHSSAEFVAFLDDCDVPKNTWLSSMVKVALHTQADIVTCMADVFEDASRPVKVLRRWVPLGPAPDLGMFHNVYGAYAGLFRRKALVSLGGYSEDAGATSEDWELYARAVLQGMRLELVPEALIWYRDRPGSMRPQQDPAGSPALRPYLAVLRPELHNAIRFSHANTIRAM